MSSNVGCATKRKNAEDQMLGNWNDEGRLDREVLNKPQTELRQLMMCFEQYDRAMRLFLRQHARLHSVRMAQGEPWSFEDEILDDMTEEQIRRIPQGCERSVVWCIWHIARIEDVTMNLLVAGDPQVVHRENWLEWMEAPACDTGNAMHAHRMAELSAALDLEALCAYRIAVGRRSREIVKHLSPEALRRKVDPVRVQRVWEEGAVVEAATGIVE